MKITALNTDLENVSKLPDRPTVEDGYTAVKLKAVFDKAGNDIKEYVNTVLIEELSSVAESASGADRIGSGYIEALPGDTVQDKLVSAASRISQLANGNIPDGSISTDKFAPEIAGFLTSGSVRAKVYTVPGSYSFKAPRSGCYKFTAVGGGAGGGVDPSNAYHQLSGGGGASLILWKELSEGDVCTVTVGDGGEGLTTEGNAFLSHAKAGEDSTVSVNGTVVATAQGAPAGLERRAASRGGSINYSGGYPKAGDHYGSSGSVVIELTHGGDSLLGNGSCYAEDTVGIGGGGFAGKYYGNAVYTRGYKGGSGAVIIEYTE